MRKLLVIFVVLFAATFLYAQNRLPELYVDNLLLNGNTLSSTNTNGDINISPNGSGTVVVNTDLDVDNINANSNTISTTNANGDLNLSPNGAGSVVINTDLDVDNLNLNANTLSSTNSNGDINLDPNGSGGVAFPDQTASRVAYLDANKELVSSATIDDTELGFLNGVTSALCGINQSCTLTNKTIDGNSNTLTVLAATQLSGAVPIANGGTGQTSKTAGMDALSPSTTKGDILVDDGTNLVRLGVGSDNQILTADAAQTTGVKWATNAGASALYRADAIITGANPTISTIAVTGYIGIFNASLTMTVLDGAAGIPCSSTNDNGVGNLTCAVGDEGLGIILNTGATMDLEVCFEFTHNSTTGSSSSVFDTFQIIQTATNAQTIVASGNGIAGSGHTLNDNLSFPHHLCGIFYDVTTGAKAYRLMFEQSQTGTVSVNVVHADADANNGQRHFRAYARELR